MFTGLQRLRDSYRAVLHLEVPSKCLRNWCVSWILPSWPWNNHPLWRKSLLQSQAPGAQVTAHGWEPDLQHSLRRGQRGQLVMVESTRNYIFLTEKNLYILGRVFEHLHFQTAFSYFELCILKCICIPRYRCLFWTVYYFRDNFGVVDCGLSVLAQGRQMNPIIKRAMWH